jgi:glucose-6-phosphate 1-dehydrogenase
VTLEAPEPQAIVVFGASGDLARKKILPALFNLSTQGLLPERHAIVGYASSEWDDEAFRAHARDAVEAFSRTGLDEETWKPFADSLSFVPGAFDDRGGLERLSVRLRDIDETAGTGGGRLFYLATPPSFFGPIVRGLAVVGQATPRARIVIEKPFGDSSRARGRSRRRSTITSTSPRSSASTTTWGRRPCRTWWSSGSATPCGSAYGTGMPSTTCS